MGDTYVPEHHPQHECPALCYVCGRGLSMFERFVRQQFADGRAELAILMAEVDELRQEVQQLAGDHPTKPNGGTVHMILTDTQQVTYTVTLGPDAAGNAATEAAPLVWTVDDPSILALTTSPDGLTATLASTGTLGTSGAHVDVPLADGTVDTLAVDPVTVVGDLPTTASLDAGVVAEKPAAPPVGP